MRVLRIGTLPGEIEWLDIGGSLEDFQKLVDGYIEPCAPIQLKQEGIELLANEEGLLKGLPLNSNMAPFFFVGDLVAVGVDYQEETFTGLNDYQVRFLIDWIYRLKLV